MDIDLQPSRPQPAGSAILALGFRPFFLLAGISALILGLVWPWLWRYGQAVSDHYGAVGWHAHEMLFGYALAVVAGFLLTAVRNWTGQHTPDGPALAALVLLWLFARLSPLLPGLPGWLIAAVDLLFAPALMLALWRPLWTGRNHANRVFLAILAAITLANGLVHAQALGLASTAAGGQRLMLDLVMLILLIVAGRVLPFFAGQAIPGADISSRVWVERAGLSLLGLLLVATQWQPGTWLEGALALLLGLVQAVRLWGWHDRRVWSRPILWVLYIGYGWLVLALILRGLAGLGVFPPNLALHAFTVGAVGVFTLGMMARVALGHSGRAMQSAPMTNGAFVLLNLGALARVSGPFLPLGDYTIWLFVSGLLWAAAFGLFVAVYLPILWRPRIDGKPG